MIYQVVSGESDSRSALLLSGEQHQLAMAAYWCNSASSWPSKGAHSRRRNSDTHLLANPITRIKKLELSRQHSLPDHSGKHLDKIFESAAINAGPEDDEWLHDLHMREHRAHTMDAGSTEDKAQATHADQKGLYSRRSSKNVGMFDKASKTFYSSDPDVSATQAHLGFPDMPAGHLNLHDLRPDLEHESEAECAQCAHTSSKIMHIFSTIVPDSYSQARKPRKASHHSRRYSLDSSMVSTKKPRDCRAADSKRAIKISRPDHVSAMYISGVDTLGGLPDDEDGQHRHRVHLLSRLSHLFLDSDPQGALSRRSSCPVIFEGEESDECLDAGDQQHLSSSLDRDSNLVSLTHRDDVLNSDHTVSSSGDLSYCQSPQTEKSRHFFVGSDPFEESDDVDQGDSRGLTKRAAPTSDKQYAAEKPHKPNLQHVDISLGDAGPDRSAREPKAKSERPMPRQVKATAAHGKHKKQPGANGDATMSRAERPEAAANHVCYMDACNDDNHSMNSKVATTTDSCMMTKPSSEDSDSSISQSHQSSATSSADESSS